MGCAGEQTDRPSERTSDARDDNLPDLLEELESTRRVLRSVHYDIHDGPLQELAALSYELHMLREGLGVGAPASAPQELDACVEGLLVRLDHLADELRSVAVAKHDRREASEPLADALRRTAELYLHSCEIELQVHLEDEDALTESQRMAIGRIVQTSLANVAQHSGATLARVSVHEGNGGVTLEVYDDGCGFDVDTRLRGALQEQRLGLAGILERVRLLGGTLDIDSRIGGPTRLLVFLPSSRTGRSESTTGAPAH